MSDFVRREPQLPDLPARLCEWSPGFARSREAARVAPDFDLATVVADAFGEYVLRLASTDDRGPDLHDALGAVEKMAVSEDPEAQHCAVLGVLIRLQAHAPELVADVGPASTALYRRWGHLA